MRDQPLRPYDHGGWPVSGALLHCAPEYQGLFLDAYSSRFCWQQKGRQRVVPGTQPVQRDPSRLSTAKRAVCTAALRTARDQPTRSLFLSTPTRGRSPQKTQAVPANRSAPGCSRCRYRRKPPYWRTKGLGCRCMCAFLKKTPSCYHLTGPNPSSLSCSALARVCFATAAASKPNARRCSARIPASQSVAGATPCKHWLRGCAS